MLSCTAHLRKWVARYVCSRSSVPHGAPFSLSSSPPTIRMVAVSFTPPLRLQVTCSLNTTVFCSVPLSSAAAATQQRQGCTTSKNQQCMGHCSAISVRIPYVPWHDVHCRWHSRWRVCSFRGSMFSGIRPRRCASISSCTTRVLAVMNACITIPCSVMSAALTVHLQRASCARCAPASSAPQ